MSIETHEGPSGHGDYERRDIGTREIFYFLAGLAVAVILVHLFLKGMYGYLDKRERVNQPAVSPLVANTPVDTRKVAPNYPDTAFPDPRLEMDERTQLNSIRLAEEQKLNSYDWVDQKAGTVRIPIERAMDLLAQRGLPVRPQETGGKAAGARDTSNTQGKNAKVARQ
jgi:hypothetical protein